MYRIRVDLPISVETVTSPPRESLYLVRHLPDCRASIAARLVPSEVDRRSSVIDSSISGRCTRKMFPPFGGSQHRGQHRPGGCADRDLVSPNQFDLARAPLFREERLKGAVEAQEHEPALVGHGLYPVAGLGVRWFGRAEVDGHGTIRVFDGRR